MCALRLVVRFVATRNSPLCKYKICYIINRTNIMISVSIGHDPKLRRNSLCAPIRSSLAVVGPMAQQLKQTRRPELQRHEMDMKHDETSCSKR